MYSLLFFPFLYTLYVRRYAPHASTAGMEARVGGGAGREADTVEAKAAVAMATVAASLAAPPPPPALTAHEELAMAVERCVVATTAPPPPPAPGVGVIPFVASGVSGGESFGLPLPPPPPPP